MLTYRTACFLFLFFFFVGANPLPDLLSKKVKVLIVDVIILERSFIVAAFVYWKKCFDLKITSIVGKFHSVGHFSLNFPQEMPALSSRSIPLRSLIANHTVGSSDFMEEISE